jgi:hypothetical protein
MAEHSIWTAAAASGNVAETLEEMVFLGGALNLKLLGGSSDLANA